MSAETEKEKAAETKMLGSLVPEPLFWAFKTAAAARKESMQDAIQNAALLYINIGKTTETQEKEAEDE